MENVKPWQVILFVVAIAALGYSMMKVGFGNSPESRMAESMMLIDVQTGQLYIRDISGKKAFIIPDRNPDSKEIALLPVVEEDGEWFLVERYASALDQIEVPHDAVPDNPEEALNVADTKPIPLN